MKFKNYITLDAIGSRGGILLAWSESYKSLQSIIKTYSAMVILERDNFQFMITSVYGPQRDAEKIIFLNEIRQLRNTNNLPWIVMGDFNMIRTHTDTTSANPNVGIMLQFNNFIQDMDFFDIPLTGRAYTWSNGRPAPTFSKLDRVLVSAQWNLMGASYSLMDAPQTVSDHTPMIMNIRPHGRPPKRTFKFETYWIKHRETRSVIQQA